MFSGILSQVGAAAKTSGVTGAKGSLFVTNQAAVRTARQSAIQKATSFQDKLTAVLGTAGWQFQAAQDSFSGKKWTAPKSKEVQVARPKQYVPTPAVGAPSAATGPDENAVALGRLGVG